MSSLIWQATVMMLCLSNLVYCGTLGTVTEKRGRLKDQGVHFEDDSSISCPTENSREPVYFPHPTDCQNFYICENELPRLQHCQAGLHFNPSSKACDYPEEVGCDSKKPKGRIIEDDSDGCPIKNPKYPVLLSHPTDCSKFYICDNGSPHLQICQLGLHFNAKLKSCDFPDQAGCDEGVTEKPLRRIVDEDDLDGCPEKNSQFPVFIQHPTDCSKFFICDSGSPHPQTCQPGLHFNRKIKACDYPENAGCDGGVTRKPKGKMVDDDNLDGCPAKNLEFPVFIQHPTDCSKFFICDSGSPLPQTCQPGLHFNPEINTCDYPENAECDNGHTEKPRGRIVDEDDLDGCPERNTEFPVFIQHPTDCSKFFICDSGSPHPQTCQPGLHFNPKLKACDYPENVECDKGASNKPRGRSLDEESLVSCPSRNAGGPILLSHPSECDKFFMCDNGKPHLKSCQPGLNFNPNLQACDYAENTVCKKQKSSVRTAFPSPYCPPVNGKREIFFLHPSNCTIFYMCSYGLAYEFVCPARLHFNLRKGECDYETEARCPYYN